MSAENAATQTNDAAAEAGADDAVDWAADDAPDVGQDEADGDNAHTEGDEAQGAGEAGDEGEGAEAEALAEGADVDDDGPPEFWSAEKKAVWAKVTDPEVRAAIKEHVAEASRAVAGKMEEAATKVRSAEESAKAAIAAQNHVVAWWQQHGPALMKLVQGRWASVDWNELSAKNQSLYVELKHQYETEMGQLQQAAQVHQAEADRAAKRQEASHQEQKLAEHAKLAAKFPAEFGTPEAADKTYGELSAFLHTRGISADRIKQVYEAPIVEIVRDAYKYRQLQAKAKIVTKSTQAAASASKTPKRIVPGATGRSANPSDEATRQAVERLRKGERLSRDDAAIAFR